MSLFEKIKNIRRSNLQEKKIKFPGGTGDIGFNAPKRREKVQKRLSRADDVYGTPDPFDPDYDKKVKKVDKRTKIGKKISSAFETPKKSELKKLDKQPGGYRAPSSEFGKGVTPGEFRVKQMDKKSFVKTPAVEYDPKTAPTGIKIPGKTYKKFRTTSSGTRNISSMNPSEMQRAFGSSSTEGGAGASGSSKTVAKDYTKKINQANKNRKEFIGNKKTFQAFKKQADAASNKLVGEREKLRSFTGKKNVDAIKKVNKKIRSTERISKGYALASQGKGNLKSPVVRSSDLKAVTDTTKKETNFTKAYKEAPRSRNRMVAKTKMGNTVTRSGARNYAKTAVPDAIKRGFKGSAGKRAVLGKGAKIVKAAAKKSPLGAIALGAAGLIGTYAAGKSLFGGKPKDTLTIKDFTKLNKMSGRSSKGITKKDGSEVRRDFFMTKKQKEDKVKRGEDIISTNRKVREKNFTNKLRSGEYRTP